MRSAALLCLLMPLPLAAQTAGSPSPTPPGQRPSGVTISVPVLVHNKKGAPEANLTKDDLTLSEDGAAQTIATLGPASGQPLTFGLLVDTSTGQRGATAEEKSASADFINAIMNAHQGAVTEKGFVVHFDREVELLQDLTPSKDKLLHGASLLDSPEPVPAGGDASGNSAQSLLYDAIYLATDEITGKQAGRKVLVLFSNGIDLGSKESLRTAIDTAQHSGTIIYAVYVKGEEPKRENKQQQNNGQGRQRGGLGYPGGGWPGSGGGGYPGGGYPGGGYPGGGYPGGGSRGGQRPQTQPAKVDGKRILADLVTPTGGRVFEMTKKDNAAAIYAMIEDDIAHQSALTFMPDHAGARPGFHSLRVESKRKDTAADAPDGFYVKEPD